MRTQGADDITTSNEADEDTRLRGHFEDATVRSALLDDLVRLRQDSGLTQNQVAEVMGTSQSAVSELEGGGTDPRLSTIQRYARSFGLSITVSIVKVEHLRQPLVAPQKLTVNQSLPNTTFYGSPTASGEKAVQMAEPRLGFAA